MLNVHDMIVRDPSLTAFFERQVIPIQPFLLALHKAGDKRLKLPLAMMAAGGVPNTVAWCEQMKTTAPALLPKPVNGMRLVAEDEPEPA